MNINYRRGKIWLRNGELWIGHLGIFWGGIWGIELTNGEFYGWAK